MTRLLYLLFVLSGAAGLMYESIWTRYLGLFVGHDAYAQIIVLVIFLGGMSLGALAVSRRSERLAQPLQGYVIIEFVVGCIGLVFHGTYETVTAWAYQSVYPGLAGSWMLTAAKWGIASALILPQSVLLGATFPLMSAGVLRLAPKEPGRTLSILYFANSLGAAAGVLIAGFWLVSLAGLPGTLLAAAMLNLLVAAGTIFVIVRARQTESEPQAHQPTASVRTATALPAPARLLLLASFATAVASFIYEIGWIRMLALVLGSATHSFELMLSAFILGLSLGAWWIRSRADHLVDPIRTLGLVQWTMGLLALATLPFYIESFDWTASLLKTFARTDAGYTGFTLARYGICLIVMLPATFCAGMTLPLITRILLSGGAGERAIGTVYSWNTLGSIVGVVAGGLILLPALGLKGMLIAGAVLDMAIGVLLLVRRPKWAWMTGIATAVIAIIAVATPKFDQALLVSGVFRNGAVGNSREVEVPFYRDGRTATVSGTRHQGSDFLALSTNGKPDASLTNIWFEPCRASGPRKTLVSDAATQTLLPLLTLAHASKARTAAIIGQGSGMSSHFLLASPHLKNLVTIEIEPQMIAGSRIFYPANRRAFDDPRSELVIDDAKSYFASAQRRFDLIMSEPSNPWVSGVSGLFTAEFYARVRQYLTEDGVFGQWLHVYELDDGLVLSVLAALHQNFPSYEIYLVPRGDLLVVASNRPTLPPADWSVAELPDLKTDLCSFVPLTPTTLQGLHLVGRRELAPLLDSHDQPNSDFYPVLDLGAERRRYRRDNATGFPALSDGWFNLISSMGRRSAPAGGDPLPTFPQNPRLRAQALAAHLRTSAPEMPTDDDLGGAIRRAEYDWQIWQSRLAANEAPNSWELWVHQANNIARLRHGGAAGQVDPELHLAMTGFMNRHNAPPIVRDVVGFRHAIASWNFAEASKAADRLLPVIQREPKWIDADELRDGAVFAKLHLGDATGARKVANAIGDRGQRGPGDLRTQLLEAYITLAEKSQGLRN